jgi:hypothetical protein
METGSSKTPSDRRKAEMQGKPQTEIEHPGGYERDLNPDRMAGQNIGELGRGERTYPNARDLKDVHRTLHDRFDDDELKAIPVVPEGARLRQGAKYLDVRDPSRREFTATGEMRAERDARIVPKDEVPYSIWNRLTGADQERIAERQGEPPEGR